MSFDLLQEKIRKKKTPIVVEVDIQGNIPPELLEKYISREGATLKAAALASEEFAGALIDALAPLIPAVSFPLASYEALGWRGMEALEKLLSRAKAQGLFTIADGKRGDTGPSAGEYAAAWLGQTKVGDVSCPAFDADCLTVSGYQGSDCLSPVLEVCKAHGKCAFVLARTANPSSLEFEDLVAGDRLVYTVMGDLVSRLGRDTGGKYGFNALGVILAVDNPRDMDNLRHRLESLFFLIPGWESGRGLGRHVEYAFDHYGRGAAVTLSRPVAGSWKLTGGRDFCAAAVETVKQEKDGLKKLVNVL